jgi:hypothetical protein
MRPDLTGIVKLIVPAVAAAAVVLVLPAVLAEDEAEYPHGDFEDDCELCHSPGQWVPAVISPEFDHDEYGFKITGSHETADCRACHATLEFGKARSDCMSCHLDVHYGELGADCGRCHTPRSFIDRTFMVRAHVATRMPLRGGHLPVDCEDCHIRGTGQYQFVNTPTQCEACHLELYAQTTDPNHQAEGFPTTCELCHTSTSWDQGFFNHAGITSPCDTCHLDDYRSADDPDHVAQNFPTQCDACHNTRDWEPASFSHNAITTGCVSCHLEDYQNTDDPNHQAAGYPTNCELCHNTRDWDDATDINHSAFFPINSGAHAGSDCSDCHTNPGNYSSFFCLGCHPHSDRDQTDRDHSEEQGYTSASYDSQACYSCHPRGN